MSHERQFCGVWISADVWLDKRLSLVEKALLAEVESFTGNGKTFHKSNDTIQTEYGISKNTIARALRKLEHLQFVDIRFNGRVRHVSLREGRLSKMERQTMQNGDAASPNVVATNTTKKTRDNTTKESKARPKDLQQVVEAFKAVGSAEEDAMQFYDYYSANGWTQGRGKPIKDWKAAARGWIRRSSQFQKNERTRKGTSGAGPTDGSLIEQHLRRLADGSGTGMG